MAVINSKTFRYVLGFLFMALASLQLLFMEHTSTVIIPTSLDEFADASLAAMTFLGDLTGYASHDVVKKVSAEFEQQEREQLKAVQEIIAHEMDGKLQKDNVDAFESSQASLRGVKSMFRKDPKNPLLIKQDLPNFEFVNSYHKVLVEDFLQAEKAWDAMNHNFTAAEIAARYGIPTNKGLKCKHMDSPTKLIGHLPCRDNCDKPLQGRSIPRILFQTWKTNYVKKTMCATEMVWRSINPDHDIILFGDLSVQRMIKMDYGENILNSYNCIAPGGTRSTIWRLLILYRYGGIYMDMDTLPINRHPFSSWKMDGHEFVTGNGYGCGIKQQDKDVKGCPHTFGMVFAPRHKILRQAIFNMLGSLAERTTSRPRDVAIQPYLEAFWKYVNTTTKQTYMPGWDDHFGNRVEQSNLVLKSDMIHEKRTSAAAGKPGTPEYLWQPGCYAGSGGVRGKQ